MTTFDTITEPWVPVVTAGGAPHAVGLREALTRAHDFAAVRDPLPLVECGLYRLLVALALDIFFIEPEPEESNLSDLAALLSSGRFDAAQVGAYFACHADRFDLFSEARPFLQTPGMEAEAPKPLAALLPPQPSGTNVNHFHHAHEDDFGVSPAAAARLLTTLAPFMTAGGAGLSPSVNGAPPWYVLPTGDTLFETICLNLCLIGKYLEEPGVPAWRDDARPVPGGPNKRTTAGYAEALTWRPRRIRLVAGGLAGRCALSGEECPSLVHTMKFAAGDACEQPFPWRDPNVSYYFSDAAKIQLPLRPKEGREAWRDTAPLALLEEGRQGNDRPAVITQFAGLVRDYIRSDDPAGLELRLTLYGMRTDGKMKIFEWQRETLALPAALILGRRFADDARAGMTCAEEAAGALRFAVKLAYTRGGGGNKAAFETRVGEASRQYFAAVRPRYDELLWALTRLDPEADAEACRAPLAGFRAALKREGWRALEEAIGDLDTDADALERWVNAREFFARELPKRLGEAPKTKEKATR